ncbi:MAG: cysteine synthase family protein [Fervidicoccaceae archaeon]
MVFEVVKLIGKTPMVRLGRLAPPGREICVKLEYLNPTGSHKDRAALYMMRDALERLGLREGDVVVEASSGNMAVSVAVVARAFGLRPVIVVDEEVSPEKLSLIKLTGAEVELGSSDPSSPRYYVRVAEDIARKRGGVFLNQYANPANVRAHYETTAREIWEDTSGRIDAFVMGVGTGGTISGVGRFLKERSPRIRVVAVTPRGSKLVGGPGAEYIDGLASKEVYPNLDLSVVDEIAEVSRVEAIETARALAREEGLLVGISAGANVRASVEVAKRMPEGSVIVTIAPDSALRYLRALLGPSG